MLLVDRALKVERPTEQALIEMGERRMDRIARLGHLVSMKKLYEYEVNHEGLWQYLPEITGAITDMHHRAFLQTIPLGTNPDGTTRLWGFDRDSRGRTQDRYILVEVTRASADSPKLVTVNYESAKGVIEKSRLHPRLFLYHLSEVAKKLDHQAEERRQKFRTLSEDIQLEEDLLDLSCTNR